MNVLCIDIGNTHTHFGLIEPDGGGITPGKILTRDIARHGTALHREIEASLRSGPEVSGIAFCSVVPKAEERIRGFISSLGGRTPVFQLTRDTLPAFVRLHYPNPGEIGQDRLANVVAAFRYFRLPCIVIDLGTAVTFDVLSDRNGYEGGIIAPGVGAMTEYLHRQTALLPRLDEEFHIEGAIGKSTSQAMKIGCFIGFGGMLEALLQAVREDLAEAGEAEPTVVLTGGTSESLFPAGLKSGNKPGTHGVIRVPDLTLKGLASAFLERISA